jgi:hypothetical protein
MATEKYNLDDLLPAYTPAGTIRDRRAVLRGADGKTVKECDTAGAKILGVNVQGQVDAKFPPGIIDEDFPLVTTGAAYNDLELLTPDNQGRWVKALPGDYVGAIAEELSAGADLLKRVQLLPMGVYRLGHVRDTRVATVTPVTIDAVTDEVIVTNLAVAGAVAVNLPAGRKGMILFIKDGKGDAGANNITVTPNGADLVHTIDGAATKVINANFGSLRLVHNGTEWNVL